MSFWDIIWFIIISFAFIAYLMLLFNILGDLFRDQTLGWMKAVWIIFLIFVPFLTALIYLIARGDGMAAPPDGSHGDMKAAQEDLHQVCRGRHVWLPSRSPRPRSCSTRHDHPGRVRLAQGEGALAVVVPAL